MMNEKRIQQNQSLNQIHKRKEVISYDLNSFDKSRFITQMSTHKMKRINQMKSINDMNKSELKELVSELQEEIRLLKTESEIKDQLILDLQVKLESSSKDGRKSQVLALLREHKTISILEIAQFLNISTKNVSSQLTYLRSDGHAIFTDPNGRKMLVETQSSDDDSDDEDDSIDEDEVETE